MVYSSRVEKGRRKRLSVLLAGVGVLLIGLHVWLYNHAVFIDTVAESDEVLDDVEFIAEFDYGKLVGLSVLAGACFGGAITLLWIGA